MLEDALTGRLGGVGDQVLFALLLLGVLLGTALAGRGLARLLTVGLKKSG